MSEQASGISFASVLGIVFIVLKLTNGIDWSWWWVLAPFWIPLAIGVIALGIFFLAMWLEDRR